MTPTAKGIATSEGQVTFLAVLGAVVAALVQLPTVVQAVAIVAAAVVTVAYILSRTRVKTTAIESPNPSTSSVVSEIDRLAHFLLSTYPNEIGAGDPRNGESAVDVAIRLLSRKPTAPAAKSRGSG